MLPDELILGLFMLVSLTFYALMGGADFGGGVWDLLAFGPRAQAQRGLIADAIAPIWEANHVWLILVIVILFSAFPAAFALITTVLHIPLTLMLFGIVLRGSAFTFRTYDSHDDAAQKLWGRIFSIASLVTPILLGITVGAISNGAVRASGGDFASVFLAPWLAPFPISVGFFALTLFAYLAAVYLTLDSDDRELQEDFRLRALWAGGAAGVFALVVFMLARNGAADIYHTLESCLAIHVLTALAYAGAAFALLRRRYQVARTLAALQVALVVWGWAYAQFPYLVRPHLTIWNASSHAATLRLLVIALAAGALILFPSFWFLYRIFKGKSDGGQMPVHEEPHEHGEGA